MNRGTRGYQAGVKMAEAILEMIHMMYNKDTSKRVIAGLISRLTEGIEEFKRVSKP